MKLYADTPARRTRQILSDVLVLLWIGLWVYAGRQVHDTVEQLRAPADSWTPPADDLVPQVTRVD